MQYTSACPRRYGGGLLDGKDPAGLLRCYFHTKAAFHGLRLIFSISSASRRRNWASSQSWGGSLAGRSGPGGPLHSSHPSYRGSSGRRGIPDAYRSVVGGIINFRPASRKRIERTSEVWPLRVSISCPVTTSQMRIVLSPLQVATRLPPGWNATSSTRIVWPRSCVSSRPAAVSMMRASPLRSTLLLPTMARSLLSGLKRIAPRRRRGCGQPSSPVRLLSPISSPIRR